MTHTQAEATECLQNFLWMDASSIQVDDTRALILLSDVHATAYWTLACIEN